MTEVNIITLQDLKGGEVINEVNRAIRSVAENLCDPKTDRMKSRTLTLKLSFSREVDEAGVDPVLINYSIDKKLCPRTDECGIFEIGEDGDGIAIGTERTLFDKESA